MLARLPVIAVVVVALTLFVSDALSRGMLLYRVMRVVITDIWLVCLL